MNIVCNEMQDKLADLVLGILPQEQADTVQQHVNSCPKCRTYLQSLQDEKRLLTRFSETLQTDMADRRESVIKALHCSGLTKPIKTPSIWKTISKSRITKFAAAAVVIVTIGFFAVQRSLVEPWGNKVTLEVAKSPAQMMTMASFSFAYRRGGIEAVEEICDQTLRMVGSRPGTISIKELLEEFNDQH